ncbi:hypothetical protein [Acinetobacter sp. SWAC57]|uniref:hypothetical protein n=1 Tax=Acinetobacter sp. SWAC57 TaxID=2293834 RepID=UPI000E5B3D27|nr:hypothetical protein [Acinetobacter sp. SWAC57]RGD91178.1 hypothetical protein DYI96_07850 [Acinetobacter sp. SWAC57]
MKKICALIFALISTTSFAQDLECPNHLVLFKQFMQEELDLLKHGDVQQLIKYNQKYNYSSRFNRLHNDQYYVNGKWIEREVYESRLADVLDFVREGNYSVTGFKLQPIKANRLISVGEICVIPVEIQTRISGDIELSTNDWIFVRSLKSNKWRTFTYLETVSAEDFKVFFPDFPSDIQLK